MAKVLAIGEIMLEMSDIGDGVYRKSFAGDTFNMAHYLSVVSSGAHQVDYLTALGEGEEDAQCLAFMRAHGVGTDECVRDADHNLGLFLLSNDAQGEKSYSYWRGQAAARELFNVPRDLSGYDWICFSGITIAVLHHRQQLVADVTAAKARGARLVYDCNYRKLLWRAEQAGEFARSIFSQMDLIKIADDELALLFAGETMATLSQAHPHAEWVLTCQHEKCETWQAGKMLAQYVFSDARDGVSNSDSNSDAVVDTSGAGDAFLAAYLAAKLDGAPPLDALHRAHAIASQVVRVKGSITPIKV